MLHVRMPRRFLFAVLALGLSLYVGLSEVTPRVRSEAADGGDDAAVRAEATGQTPQSAPTELRPADRGRDIVRELKAGETHAYRLTTAARQYIRLTVEERGGGYVATLEGPGGLRSNIESPKGTQDIDALSFIAESGGEYRVTVSSPEKEDGAAGRYILQVVDWREAVPEDESRVAAQLVHAEARRLDRQATAESRRQAITKYEEAIALWRKGRDRQQEISSINYLGGVYRALGESPKALEQYSEALRLARETGERTGEARSMLNLGTMYGRTGEHQKALDYYQQAVALFRVLGETGNEAVALSDMGLIYTNLGEIQKGLTQYERALPLFRANGRQVAEAITLNNIGIAYFNLGEHQKALDYYSRSLALRQSAGDVSGASFALNNIGRVYRELGELEKSLDYYERSLVLRRAEGNRTGEAASLFGVGVVQFALGDERKALDNLEQALPLMRAVKDRRGEAYVLIGLGTIYRERGDGQKATAHLEQALPLMRSTGDRRGEAITLTDLGIAAHAAGDAAKAQGLYSEALKLNRLVGHRNGEANTLYHLARLKHQGGDVDGARGDVAAALAIVESIRTDLASPELRTSYLATMQNYYRLYVELLMQLHRRNPAAGHDAEALHASERARARTLLEILREARADIRQNVDAALIERERALQRQLNGQAFRQMRLLSGKHTPEQAAELTREINTLTAEYQSVQSEIRRRSPRYAALTQPAPLTLREIQTSLLDSDTLLLEYALGEERSFLWAVTPQGMKSFELPKRSDIEQSARRVYELLSDGKPWAAGDQVAVRYADAARRLSEMILPPALAPELGKKRLLVVTEGALQYVPFGALTPSTATRTAAAAATNSPAARSAARAADVSRPLILDHEIVSLPSASTLSVLRREAAARARSGGASSIAVIADPVFEPDDERVASSLASKRGAGNDGSGAPSQDAKPKGEMAQGSRTRSLWERAFGEGDASQAGARITRLPFTRREAEAITGSAPAGTAFKALDFRASRETAMSPELARARFVHFATHGLLNGEHPELSGVVLSLVNEDGQSVDGFLRLNEIYNLNLSAEMVVLSACQTALGKEIRGEGLVGLTRGFMYAGAPRVVASLWRVDDAATAELMKRFYEGVLKKGMRPAAALRAAKVELWRQKRWHSPYYWAAFELQGEWR